MSAVLDKLIKSAGGMNNIRDGCMQEAKRLAILYDKTGREPDYERFSARVYMINSFHATSDHTYWEYSA